MSNALLIRRGVGATVLALAAATSACGSSDPGAPAQPPAASTAAARVALRIESPGNGEQVRARRTAGRLNATMTVRGTARAGALVTVSAKCDQPRCTVRTRADVDGRFRTTVIIRAQTSRPSAFIVAGYGADRGAEADRVIVLLDAPGSRNTGGASLSAAGRAETDRGAGAAKRSRAAAAVDDAPPPSSPAPAGNRGPGLRRFLMIGDSLGQGTAPLLPGLLPGWQVDSDARRDRTLSAGMQVLAATTLPAGPAVLAFSLFTNDDPRSVSALESAVRTSLRRAGSGGCVVWATIVRPPVGGRGYGGVNRRLEQLAADSGGRLRLVAWAAAVRDRPSLLAGDGVHATAEGYRTRAAMYAGAAQSC